MSERSERNTKLWAGAGAEERPRSQGAIRAELPEQPGKALRVFALNPCSMEAPSGSTWTKEQDERARKEALWLKSCSDSHKLWCTCNDWKSHVKGIVSAPWRLTGEDGDVTGDTTEDLAAAIADAFAADAHWDVVTG